LATCHRQAQLCKDDANTLPGNTPGLAPAVWQDKTNRPLSRCLRWLVFTDYMAGYQLKYFWYHTALRKTVCCRVWFRHV